MRTASVVVALCLAVATVAGCRGDDPTPPDVFVDYDAHGMLPDGSVDDFAVPDAGLDATAMDVDDVPAVDGDAAE